jgi:hypothetical protein
MALHDDNNCYVGLADNSTTAVPIKVSNIDGRLLVHVYKKESTTLVQTTGTGDDNFERVSLADGDDGKVYPLHIDNINGYLKVKFS